MRAHILIIIFSAWWLVACSKKEENSPADFRIAISETASEDFLLKMIDRRPGNISNYIRLADVYYNAGDLVKAIAIMEEALSENPGNNRVKLMLAQYHLERGQTARAEEVFLKLPDESEGVDYSAVQAALLIEKGFYDKALQIISRSISKDKGNAELYFLKGMVMKNLSDTVAALHNFKTAVQLENVRFPMVVNYLDILAAMGKPEEFFENYNSLSPEIKRRPELKLIMAEILVDLQQPDSAKSILFGVKEEDLLSEKYAKLGQIYLGERKYDSAMYYARLSQSKKENLRTQLLIARTFDKMYKYQDAENTYLEILEKDSTFTVAAEELDYLRRKVRYLRQKALEEKRREEMRQIQPLTPIIQPKEEGDL